MEAPQLIRLQPPSSWSELPNDILILIFERISDWSDLYQCLTVSWSWHSHARPILNKLTSTPYLLLPESLQNQPSCNFLNLNTKTLFSSTCPQLSNSSIYYSIGGWLVIRSNNYKTYYLYNPINRDILHLPTPLKDPSFIKWVTSTSPRDPKCVVAAVSDSGMVLVGRTSIMGCRKMKSYGYGPYGFIDIMFHNGELHALSLDAELYVLELLEQEDKIIFGRRRKIVKRLEGADYYWGRVRANYYLVEEPVTKELMLIESKSFRIFKICHYKLGGREWRRVKKFDSDHHALLLGSGDSMFVSTVDHDDDQNCFKPNCIYFVDRFCKSESSSDYLKVYDLIKGTLKPFNVNPPCSSSSSSSSSFEELSVNMLCRWFKPSIN